MKDLGSSTTSGRMLIQLTILVEEFFELAKVDFLFSACDTHC